MNLFGLEIRRTGTLAPVSDDRGGWRRLIREPFKGAWQRNQEIRTDLVLAHHAVYACITRISQDIGKLRPKLVERDDSGVWSEISSPAFSGVLNQPNRFQNYIQFQEWWIASKLIHGNTYALLERDGRGIVSSIYILDPNRVVVLVASDGTVFYELRADNLAGLETERVAVPATEIIHDRMNCLFHPLVGVSPIYACGTAANMGLEIQNNSSAFFGNGSNPSGILTSPIAITPDKSAELTAIWNAQFSASGSGGVAVLGNGMQFNQMSMSAVDAQLIEQLKWTVETVCSTFHVPPFKIGVGEHQPARNVEQTNQIYYSDCLQSHIEAFELCMDQALGLRTPTNTGRKMGVELDLDGLLRMDTAGQITTLKDAIAGSILTPNEARQKMDKSALPGGDTIYMQQQNFSIAALAERDKNKPFSKPAPAPAAPAATPALSSGVTQPLALPSGETANRAEALARRVSRRARLMRMEQVWPAERTAFPAFEKRAVVNAQPITLNLTVPERSTSITVEGSKVTGTRTGKITRNADGTSTIEMMESPSIAKVN